MAFDLMRHHGVVSFVQQLCHFLTSVQTIFYINWGPTFPTIIGGILEAGYLSSIAFILVLSLNRCDLMYDFKLFPSISRKIFYSIASILCYVYYCLVMVFFLLPGNRMMFKYRHYEWSFVEDGCLTSLGFTLVKWNIYSPLIVSFILYVLTFSKIIYLRCKKQKSTYFFTEDIKLIVHIVITYVLIICMEICWNGHFFNIYKTQFGALIPQIMYILISGANTTFTLFFVRDVRNNAFGRCCSKSIVPASRIDKAQIKSTKVVF
uniref:7TM_GPCR_Srx domain-containing protein n=1 Tax=Strongyloides papillosus TaxID=174720 RepID=A0A0N5B367_STREA